MPHTEAADSQRKRSFAVLTEGLDMSAAQWAAIAAGSDRDHDRCALPSWRAAARWQTVLINAVLELPVSSWQASEVRCPCRRDRDRDRKHKSSRRSRSRSKDR